MKIATFILLLLLAGTGRSYAAEPVVSEASVRELLEIAGVQELLQSAPEQVDELLQVLLDEAFEGEQLTQQQRQAFNELRTKTVTLFNEALSSAKLRKIIAESFTASLTQAEIDALLNFYRTEAGRSLRNKLPLIRRKAEQLIEAELETLEPKIEQLVEETLGDMK